MKRKKRGEICSFCGRNPGFSPKSPYCRECSHVSARMKNERLSPGVQQSLRRYVRRKYYVCAYTQLELDVFDYTSPFFLEFDHVVPNDPKKVVICCSWVNEMKGDMMVSEFHRSVKQLFNLWFKGIKMKKQKFRYWYRLRN